MNNYAKGARFERKIVNNARKNGLIAFRSAGSHSPIDVCIINLKERTIRFIQCKAGKFSEKKRHALLSEFCNLNGNFFARFEVLCS